MTSAAPVSVRGNADPRIIARAEADKEENEDILKEEPSEIPEEALEEAPEQEEPEVSDPQEKDESEEPEQPSDGDNEEATEGDEESQEPTDPDKEQEPEKSEEDQVSEDPTEKPEEENPEAKDPEKQDPETENPDEEVPEVQDPDAQDPAEGEPGQEEDEEKPEADPTEEEDQTPEIFDVTYELYPEEGGKINVSTTVKEGYTLGFNVKVYEGYELSSVVVSGETLDYTHVNEENSVYYFKKEAVEEAPVIEVYFEETVPAANSIKLMNMAMLLRVGEETVPADNFEIYKDGSASGEAPSQDILAGDFEDNAPDLSSEQLYFDHAEVNGSRVYSVGMLDDIVYYGSLTGSLTILEDGEKIELHYVTEYTVSYNAVGAVSDPENPEKVSKGSTLSFYAEPSAIGQRLIVTAKGDNGLDLDLSDSGRVVDSKTGRTLYSIDNIEENITVNISEVEIGTFTFRYDNSLIRQGEVTEPSNNSEIQAGSNLVIHLESTEITKYTLNLLYINGYAIDTVPTDAAENDSVTSYLPTGEEVVVTLISEYNPGQPWNYHTEYTVTIKNVHTDITITEGNFKNADIDEIILRQLDGVEEIIGYYYDTGIFGIDKSRWDIGAINSVYNQTPNTGNKFYFNLQPGYNNPKLIVTADNVEFDNIEIQNRSNNLDQEWENDGSKYKYRFDIPSHLNDSDNIGVYLSAEPIEFTVTYVNDKNQDDVIGQPEGGYSVIEGSKDVLTITSRTPYITDPNFYADGWVVRGDTSGHVYHAGDNVNIEDIAQYASGTNTIVFYPNWVHINNGEQRNVSVNIYIEDPFVTGSDQVPAGQYNETVSKDGRGILEVDMEQAKDIIAKYLADKGIAIYNASDYEIRDGENVFIVEETAQSIDVHFDLRKADLKVNFAWGSAEDEPADGSVTLPQSETISAAIEKPYTYSYSDGTIPEGYMAANDIDLNYLDSDGAELTIYLYKDADKNSIPDTQSIELKFKADSATVKGIFSTYDGVDEGYDPALTDSDSVLTYELLKEYKEYSLKQGNGQAVTTTKSGQNYPSVPETIAAAAGYERVSWNLDGGSALYGSYATLRVKEDAIDVSFTAEYDVKDNYHKLTVKYVDHDDPQNEISRIFTGLVAEGQKVQYPIPVISGYTNPDEGTYKDYIGTASDETITVEYYADADGNGKPDEFTIEIVFEGTGHGSWVNTWTDLKEGKDYKVSRVSQDSDSPMQLIVYLVKENDAGFEADKYPAAPGVNAETYYIFDHWDNKSSKGNEYGTTEDGTLVGNTVSRNAVNRNYISLYFDDKDNSGTPDVQEYITVVFKAGMNGKLKDTDGSEKDEIRKENFLPGYDRYPAAPAVNPDTDYIFTGWDKTYNAGNFIQDKTKEQVFTAQYYENLNHNDKPDWQEYVTVTFDEGDYGSIDNATDGKVAYNKLLPGKDKYPAAPQVVPDNGYAFTGWDPVYDKAYTVLNETDNRNQLYIAQYGEDANGDKVPDANQITVTFRINEPGISFKKDGLNIDGKKIVLNTDGTELTYWLIKGVSDYPSAPDKDDLNIPAEKKLALAAWEDASGQEYALSGEVKADAAAVIYTAQFGKDEDGDGVVDPDEPENPDDPGHGGDTDPDDPGHGGDTPGGNTPGGGDHGGSTGPTPVSISNSGNPEDNYYTVGVNGQWVHMDNADINVPLDEPVPADATAIGAPEWHRWRFYLANGTMLYNQWGHIENPYAADGQPRSGWFYFDENGLMRYGWYLDARRGDWYYMHSESDGMLGTMITGWHYDTSDGKWYYLDPATGAMKTGWQEIGGKWYYFNPTPVAETWSYDGAVSVWRFNGNTVRPYGSMYQNEMTPDGYYVDADGVWVQ